MVEQTIPASSLSFPAGGEALAVDFGCRIPAVFRVRVLNFSSAVYVLSLHPRLTVSPNYKIPANSF